MLLGMSSPTISDERNLGVRRGRATVLLVLLAVAVLGGAVAIGIAAAAGALHEGSHTTTIVQQTPTSTPSTSSLTGPWSTIYTKAAPGVVAITVNSSTSVQTPFGEREEQQTAEGTGIVLDGNGDILTAAHVVSGATTATITFPNGVKRSAKVLGHDNSTDAAVVKVDPAGLSLHPLSLGSSRAVAVGDPLAVVGTALGFEGSMSTGVVSGLDRTIEAPSGFTIAHAIQTDAAMNPGNSGGPLLDSSGQVVGIADQIATGNNQFGRSTSETSTGVGFAVPIELIKAEIAQLERGAQVSHAYLGVEMAGTSETGQAGATVQKVTSHTPAAKAGLKAGDRITAVNGTPITDDGDLTAVLAEKRPGENVTLTLVRGGQKITLTVKLGAQPAQAPSA
jgi:S1-C subfamily serine protease